MIESASPASLPITYRLVGFALRLIKNESRLRVEFGNPGKYNCQSVSQFQLVGSTFI